MDHFSVLNYQGSKKNLLAFIHTAASPYIRDDSTILDIFSGTCSVGYSYKRNHCIYANDSELYAYIISTALLGSYQENCESILDQIESGYCLNNRLFRTEFAALQRQEQDLLRSEENAFPLVEFYEAVPTVWNSDLYLFAGEHNNFELFTTYYSNSYFGIQQAMDIDSIRYAIEKYKNTKMFYPLLTALFFAMKECVFSKDGHMAQPLSLSNNKAKLFGQRNKSIYTIFKEKFRAFFSEEFVNLSRGNRTYNLDFEALLEREEIRRKVDFIYADPPYTDMQYSRYYHLLNIAARYDYPAPTKNAGKYTKGLYTAGRFQSRLSTKSTCLETFHHLIDFASACKKFLAISFAYPADTVNQETKRYVMSIEDIKNACAKAFGAENVETAALDYAHSNNRNSAPKKVIEYLIMCNGYRR